MGSSTYVILSLSLSEGLCRHQLRAALHTGMEAFREESKHMKASIWGKWEEDLVVSNDDSEESGEEDSQAASSMDAQHSQDG